MWHKGAAQSRNECEKASRDGREREVEWLNVKLIAHSNVAQALDAADGPCATRLDLENNITAVRPEA